MKKLAIYAVMAMAGATFFSCGNTPKASLKTDVDTLSYAIGKANGAQMTAYLAQQGIDSAYIADFVRGFKDGSASAGDKKKAAYVAGLQAGANMTSSINNQIFAGDSIHHVSQKNLVAGLIDGVKKNDKIMTSEVAMNSIESLADRVHTRIVGERYKEVKEKNAKFLADNAKKPGVKTLPSGVQYKVLSEGNGALPTDSSKVKVDYEGKTIDGTVFDSSIKRGQPMECVVRQNIPGFAEALTHMPVGSEWEVYIPAEKAYGERDMGQIKPFSTLIFKVKLLSIEK